MRQIRLIAANEFAHIKADPLMVRLILFPVLLQLFVFGYALTTEVKNTPIAVVDRSATPQSRSLIASVKASPLFAFEGSVPDEGTLRRMLDDGTVRKPQGKKGDMVLFTSYAGTDVKIDGKEYLIMSESDIMAVIEK